MRNANRTRNMHMLNWGFGIVASFITMMLISITQAQASPIRSPGEQTSTAMYFGEGKYTIDAVWQGTQYTDVCREKNYGGDVALTLFDDGTFALIFKADKHYETWATLGSAVSCIGPVRPSFIVDHYFIGTYTSNPLQMNFQRAFSIDQSASERELRFSSGQVSFNEASAVGEVKYWMYINHQSDAEGKAFFTLLFDLSRAGGAILATPTVTEAVGDCTALISNIDNLTPGEVLSPAIEFVDESGKPTGIIGHALFINGMQTWSVIWDGKETQLEVQYTCLNHRGYSKQAVIPAYQGTASGDPGGAGGTPPQPPQAPPAGGDSGAPLQPGDGSVIQPGQAPPAALPGIPGGLPTAIGILGMAVGLGGAAISGGAVVVSVLNTALAKPPAATRVPAPRQPAPRVEKTTARQQPTQKGKEQPGEKEKKEPKEKKPERKGLLQSEKEALKQYQDALDNLSGNVEKAIELSEKIRELSPEGRKKLQKKLSDFKDSLDKVSKRAGNYADKIEMVQDMEEKLKSLGEKYKQIQKAHQEAFKDLQDVPEGAANQLADLTTAIETFGDVTDAALSRIPYFKHIYSDKTFEVTKSFREFTTGLRKTLAKTVFRTSIEGKTEFTPEELKQFSDGRTNRRLDPEMQEWYRQQARQQPKTQPNSVLQQIKDFIFGKEISPEVKSMR